jgi:hypothetical protein
MRDREQRVLVEEALSAVRDGGRPLPSQAARDLGERFDHDFGDVAVHTGPRAAGAASRLGARAFAVGRHIVFGRGEEVGGELLAHEAAHVAASVPGVVPPAVAHAHDPAEEQARSLVSGRPTVLTRSALVQRAVIRNATGTATDFEFRAGVELRLEFMQLAQQLIGPGVLHNRGLRALRDAALNAHGTVDDAERMFMAGLTVASNAALLRALRLASAASVTFPLATITPNVARVEDLGRETVPASVTAPAARAVAAMTRFDVAEMARELTAAETAASREITARAGTYRDTAGDVIDFATTRRVSLAAVLEAMLSAASDSSPGDRVFAAMVYAIAAAAGMPEAGELRAGRIKVDALVPSAFSTVPGAADKVAFYVTVPQASGVKGDTVYVPTSLDVYDVSDRSNVVHELTHARDDRAAAGATVTLTATDRLEARAYRAQGRYLLTELAATPSAERPAVIATLAGRVGVLALWGLLIECLSDRTRFEPLVVAIAAASTPPVSAARVRTTLNRGAAALETSMLADINRLYGLPAGQRSPVDGLSGSSLVHWVFRL